ncbi:MAG: phospholipase D family protein [Rhodothermales bacterium]|nr:phospholipase D family protein [Rhodothermales bacterium]
MFSTATTEHAGQTGIFPLAGPRQAFVALHQLVDAAQDTIDALYYIWRGDQSGLLLFEALWRAAERGVRVRLLLDDGTTEELDPTLAGLDTHPNIEVRIYNPLRWRKLRYMNALTDFWRSNRRMHNKSLTVDGKAIVTGGRNVGNEYYAEGDGMAFTDLDVLAIGAVVEEAGTMFDLYWTSTLAAPISRLVPPAGPAEGERLLDQFTANRMDPDSTGYMQALYETPILTELEEGKRAWIWTEAHLLYDDPLKTLGHDEHPEVLLLTQLLEHIGSPVRRLDLVSAYFVPMAAGTATLKRLSERGVQVRVLTNSLESTDVTAVHAGYAKRRKALLRAGVQLFELKRGWGDTTGAHESIGGSSAASLHAKTFALDDRHVFVGSFNFDPRSARFNTEMGLLLDSPDLARRLSHVFDAEFALTAYEVYLTPEGRLEWLEWTPEGKKRHTIEPGTTAFRRLKVRLLALLPFEWML